MCTAPAGFDVCRRFGLRCGEVAAQLQRGARIIPYGGLQIGQLGAGGSMALIDCAQGAMRFGCFLRYRVTSMDWT